MLLSAPLTNELVAVYFGDIGRAIRISEFIFLSRQTDLKPPLLTRVSSRCCGKARQRTTNVLTLIARVNRVVTAIRQKHVDIVRPSSGHTSCRYVLRLKYEHVNEKTAPPATHSLRCFSGAPVRTLRVARSTPIQAPRVAGHLQV